MSQKEQEQQLSEMPIFVMSLERGRHSNQGFFCLRDALAYIAATPTDLWLISTPLEVGLEVRLTSDGNLKYVHLNPGERKSVVPRSSSAHPDGIVISTDYNTILDIIFPVAAPDDKVFDRGLFWVSASDPQKAFLETIILPNHGLSDNELVQRYIQAQRTVLHFINDLLNGRSSSPKLT